MIDSASPIAFWEINKSKLSPYFANRHSFATWVGKYPIISFNNSEKTIEKILTIRKPQVELMQARLERRAKKEDWLVCNET